MNEELLAELAAMRRLIEKLHHDIARLIQQQQRTEQAAEPRPRDDDDDGWERLKWVKDDDGMVIRKGGYTIDHGRGAVTRDDDEGSD